MTGVLQDHLQPGRSWLHARAISTNDFACYSFVPRSDVPIKIIVLDDTVKGPDQPNYAAGAWTTRANWLVAELQAGQAANSS